jgi:hypothetical protein
MILVFNGCIIWKIKKKKEAAAAAEGNTADVTVHSSTFICI